MIVVLAGMTLNMVGCKPATAPSLYDQNQKYISDPVVDSLSPAGSALAGIDTVTIYGRNFSSNPDSELVFFVKPGVPNNTVFRGTVFSVTPNRLSVQAPALYGDTIYVQVTVHGALLYGTASYKIVNAVSEYGGLSASQVAYGLSGSAESELYGAISSNNVDRGIFKLTRTSSSTYAGPTTGLVGWNALKFGPGGYQPGHIQSSARRRHSANMGNCRFGSICRFGFRPLPQPVGWRNRRKDFYGYSRREFQELHVYRKR